MNSRVTVSEAVIPTNTEDTDSVGLAAYCVQWWLANGDVGVEYYLDRCEAFEAGAQKLLTGC